MRTARELTLEAAQSAAINRTSSTDYSSKTYSPAHIKKLLDSRHEREVLDGMRRVISVQTKIKVPYRSQWLTQFAIVDVPLRTLPYIFLSSRQECS